MTHSVYLKGGNSNHHRFCKNLISWQRPIPTKTANPRSFSLKVSVYGDAAVATGIWRAKGTEQDKPFDEVERFTDTYVKTGGEWKCVASHSSPMKAK